MVMQQLSPIVSLLLYLILLDRDLLWADTDGTSVWWLEHSLEHGLGLNPTADTS